MRNVDCINCGSKERLTLAKQSFDDEYLDLIDHKYNKIERQWVKCEKCKLIYHNPQLDKKDIDILYSKFRDKSFRNEVADEYFQRIISLPPNQSENYKKIEWLGSKITSYLEKGGSILDIGSGGGVFLNSFINKYSDWKPYGVEPTEEFADLTERQLKCPVHSGNYKRNLFDKKFDLVVCNQVLEHTIDPILFLKDIYSDLKYYGYLYLEVPDAADFAELPETHDRFLSQHLWYFSEQSFRSILNKYDFEIIHLEKQRTFRNRNNLIALLRKKIL